MPRPNPRPAPTPENTSSIETEATGNETIAERARQMAERIRRLPDELVASFALTDSRERVSRMRGIATELSFGMFPVITWLERRRSADTAELVKRRLSLVLHEAVQCAGFEIPEYVGGVIRQNGGQTPSEGARRTGELTATSILFAASLQEWADDIETEDKQRLALSPSAKQGETASESSNKRPESEQPRPDGPEMLSSPDLADRYNVNPEALRKRLERWMPTHQEDWKEITDRRPREPKYLYRVFAVLPIIKELQASGQPSGERPAE